MIHMNSQTLSQLSRIMIGVLTAASLLACTNERRMEAPLETSPGSAKATSRTVSCSAEDLATFDRPEGEVLDLDREPLPKGLYLANLSEMLVERKLESGAVARLLARELQGSKNGEIICSENMEKLAPFDLAIMGLVKFDTSVNPAGESFTARQFYVFSDRNGHGVILSNPELGNRGQDLKRFLTTGMARGQFVRLTDRQYLLRFVREREGARIRLSIRLELVPSGY